MSLSLPLPLSISVCLSLPPSLRLCPLLDRQFSSKTNGSMSSFDMKLRLVCESLSVHAQHIYECVCVCVWLCVGVLPSSEYM